MNDAALTRAEKIVLLGNRTFIVKDLSDRQTIELDERLRREILKLDPSAVVEALAFSWSSQEGLRVLSTPIGLGHVFDLALQYEAIEEKRGRPDLIDLTALATNPTFGKAIFQNLVRPLFIVDEEDRKSEEGDNLGEI